METGNGDTGNGDETKRKNSPGQDWPGSVGEASQGRKLKMRPNQNYPDSQQKNDPQFDKCAQVTTRGHKKPDPQNTPQESINNDGHGQDPCGIGEPESN